MGSDRQSRIWAYRDQAMGASQDRNRFIPMIYVVAGIIWPSCYRWWVVGKEEKSRLDSWSPSSLSALE